MDFNDLIINRFSARSFTGKPVDRETILEFLDAARFAPSAVNFQPWHFIVVTSPEKLNELHQAYPRTWFREAPACIVVCADHRQSWKRRSDNRDFAYVDVAIVTDHLILKATELGLGTCWVCNFNVDLVRKFLNTPEHVEPMVLVPLGYTQAKPPSKIRKPLDETVHWETF